MRSQARGLYSGRRKFDRRVKKKMLFPLVESLSPDLVVAKSAIYEGCERRSKPRIRRRFPATVKAINSGGHEFEAATELDNLSANGLYLRLSQQIETGAEIWITFKLAVGPTKGLKVRRVAVRGLVLRSEMQPDNRIGVAVSITHHKFL